MKSSRPWRLRAAVLAAVILAPGRAAAQDPPAAARDSAPPPPRPIPADSIPDLARADAAILSGLRSQLPTDSALARMDSTLAMLEARYADIAQGVAPERLETTFYDELLDLESALGRLQSQLDRWAGDAGTHAARVGDMRDTLQMIRDRWSATREQSWRALPPAWREQVTGILRLTDSLAGAWQPVLHRVLSTQGGGARLAIVLGERVDAVQAAQDRVRRQVLRQDSRPLWQALPLRPATVVPDAIPPEEPPGKLTSAVRYLSEHAGRVRLHAGLFVLVSLVFWLVGRRRETWATAEYSMHWPSSLLAHPIAAGLVLSLLFLRLLYPGAPQGVLGLGALVLLPALVTLLRSLLDRRYRAPAYVLVGLWGAYLLAYTLAWPGAAARIAFLVLAGAGTVTMVWLAGVAARQERWGRTGRVLARTGAALLAVAFLANVLGYVMAADLLVSATLTIGLATLALIALADVIAGAVLVALFATPVGQLHVIRRNRDVVIGRVRHLVRLVAFLLWVSVALRAFRVLRPALEVLGTFLSAPRTLGSFAFTVGEILIFFVTLAVSISAARGLRGVLRYDVLARMDRGVPEAASSIVYYVVLALGVLFAAGAAGIEVGRLAIIAGALGVGIGFGLQTIVANFIAGLILLFERPIKPGDTVELEGLMGVVQAIGIRASTVRTFQGADVIVPNQDLIAGRVINWTLSDQTRRVEVPVGVAYGTDPARVMAILHEVLAAQPRVLRRPAPVVLFMKYGDSSLDFEVRFWSQLDDWLEVRSELLAAIAEAFARHGIEIPFPQRDLHIRSGLPAPPGSPPAASP
jgi:potassium-dependent mechanosensitive channel